MRLSATLLLATPFLVATAAPAFARSPLPPNSLVVAAADAPDIQVQDIWARPSAGRSMTSAAYFTLVNRGAADRLTGAATPIANSAELHESSNENGVMKMRHVPTLALDPGKPVTLAPGGYHVMLMGLKNPLKTGDSFPLTLSFERAPPVTVTVKVGTMGGHDQMGHRP